MEYRYKRGQLFAKRLNVPTYVKRLIYNNHLYLTDYIEYELYDKIPVTCLRKSDREIVERFGIEKCKTLDFELLKEINPKILFRLMSLDSNVEDINKALYEALIDDLEIYEYSHGMMEVYSNRFFSADEISEDPTGLKGEFNRGWISLDKLLHNWELFKDKDIGYVLRTTNIDQEELKKIMNEYYEILEIISRSTYINLNELILEDKEVIEKTVKEELAKILKNKTRTFRDDQYKIIFSHISLKEFLAENVDEYFTELLYKELDYYNINEDELFSMDIPIKKLFDREILYFVAYFGIKNVLDFEKECGKPFTSEDCKLLDVVYDAYLHYSGNIHDLDKNLYIKEYEYDENGKSIYKPYSKESFYETIKRMIIYGPTDWNYIDQVPNYKNIKGLFRESNPDLFMNEEAPEKLQELFYTKKIHARDLKEHPEYIEYLRGKDFRTGFKQLSLKISNYEYTNLFMYLSNKMDFDTFINFIINYSKIIDSAFIENNLFNEPLAYSYIFNDNMTADEISNIFSNMSNDIRIDLCDIYKRIEDYELKSIFREFVNQSDISTLSREKLPYIEEVLIRLTNSNSKEMYNFRSSIASQILRTDNPLESLEKVEKVFIENNIPTVGKLYLCFDILHPNFEGFNMQNNQVSPMLKESTDLVRKIIVFQDLIKCSFGSNNKSVQEYLGNIEYSCSLLSSIESGKINFNLLSEEEKRELATFSKHLYTLYNNSMLSSKKENYELTGDILKDISELKRLMAPKEGEYNLEDRVIKMFCGFAGISTMSEAKKYIRNRVEDTDKRNRLRAQTPMTLEVGDLIKGIGEVKYLRQILQNGSVSKEYLGAYADSDATPLDTDVSMILTEGTIEQQIDKTAAKGYGPIWFVLKKDDRFIESRKHDEEVSVKRDMSKLELFSTGVLGEGHYGIRTGFASSDIDYIMMDSYDPRVGLEIALNGFYIPIVNKEGKIIFTFEDYDLIRNKMQGLAYYDEYDYEFSEELVTTEVEAIALQLDNNFYETARKRAIINNAISEALTELGLGLKTKIDGDITEGIVELIDTGSTGRSTNKVGDGDFDFMMRLDRKILLSKEQEKQLKETLLRKFGKDNSEVISSGDFRLKGVQLGDVVVDIDITFVPKTNDVTYSTDMSLQDRLTTIRSVDGEKYKYVIANILLAKQILKDAGAYKPNRGEIPQGGLGGVGVENWILQNGGSLVSAARNFLAAAEGKDFEEFKKSYSVWDFGENHMASKNGKYSHDDFVFNNMSSDGYEKMKKALKEFLLTYESSKKR